MGGGGKRAGFLVALVFALGAFVSGAAEEDKVRLEVTVTSEAGDPIAYASVYLKFKEERTLWKDKRREWLVKTNPEGHAFIPEAPTGKALVQVIAKGWKTYGEFHELAGPKQTIEIKLKRPRKWY